MDQENNNQKEVNIETLYPSLGGERLSASQRQFMGLIKPDQWAQPQPETKTQTTESTTVKQKVQNYPIQQLKYHVIRSHQAWKDLVKDTVDWVNKNIHPMRIISITVVLCHSTRAGQCTIFYNDSKDQYMKMKISPYIQHGLLAAIVDTGKNWQDHHKDVMKTGAQLSSGGGIIGISQLQTNMTHNRATSVIWFLKKY